MVSLSRFYTPELPIPYHGDIYLRVPRMTDFEEWADLRQRSRAHLEPFEPDWREDQFTKSHYKKRMKLYAKEIAEKISVPFHIYRASDDCLVGVCILSNLRFRSAMTGTIGYWIGEQFLRKGYGYSAVFAAVTFGFNTLNLLRFEAACLPENTASQNLLKKIGFEEEGRAKEYLHINGKRRDHILFGLTPSSCNADLANALQIAESTGARP